MMRYTPHCLAEFVVALYVSKHSNKAGRVGGSEVAQSPLACLGISLGKEAKYIEYKLCLH